MRIGKFSVGTSALVLFFFMIGCEFSCVFGEDEDKVGKYKSYAKKIVNYVIKKLEKKAGKTDAESKLLESLKVAKEADSLYGLVKSVWEAGEQIGTPEGIGSCLDVLDKILGKIPNADAYTMGTTAFLKCYKEGFKRCLVAIKQIKKSLEENAFQGGKVQEHDSSYFVNDAILTREMFRVLCLFKNKSVTLYGEGGSNIKEKISVQLSLGEVRGAIENDGRKMSRNWPSAFRDSYMKVCTWVEKNKQVFSVFDVTVPKFWAFGVWSTLSVDGYHFFYAHWPLVEALYFHGLQVE